MANDVLDPAVIKRAAEAFEDAMDEYDDVIEAVEAAAPLIVAATAEAIAAAIEAKAATFSEQVPDDVWWAMWHDAAAIAHGFTAGGRS